MDRNYDANHRYYVVLSPGEINSMSVTGFKYKITFIFFIYVYSSIFNISNHYSINRVLSKEENPNVYYDFTE